MYLKILKILFVLFLYLSITLIIAITFNSLIYLNRNYLVQETLIYTYNHYYSKNFDNFININQGGFDQNLSIKNDKLYTSGEKVIIYIDELLAGKYIYDVLFNYTSFDFSKSNNPIKINIVNNQLIYLID